VAEAARAQRWRRPESVSAIGARCRGRRSKSESQADSDQIEVDEITTEGTRSGSDIADVDPFVRRDRRFSNSVRGNNTTA